METSRQTPRQEVLVLEQAVGQGTRGAAARTRARTQLATLPPESSLKPVVDAARSVVDALDGTPGQHRQSLTARNTQA